MRDAGGVGTAAPAPAPPLVEGAEQAHSCACTEAGFVLLSGLVLLGTPGLSKETQEREVPPTGCSSMVEIRTISWGS